VAIKKKAALRQKGITVYRDGPLPSRRRASARLTPGQRVTLRQVTGSSAAPEPEFAEGDQVEVPWGLDVVPGVVIAVHGPAGNPQVEVQVELPSDGGVVHERVRLPIDALDQL
jgi:hypothetical protein